MKKFELTLVLVLMFMFSGTLTAEEKVESTAPKAVTTVSDNAEQPKPATVATEQKDVAVAASEPVTTAEKEVDIGVFLDSLENEKWNGPRYFLKGFYRVRGLYIDDISMGVQLDNMVPDNSKKEVKLMYHRLMLQPKVQFNKSVEFNAELDIFNDRPLGLQDGTVLTYDVSDKAPNIILRGAYGKILTPVGLLIVGRMASRMGYGIVDEDGNKTDYLFGDSHFGDTYDRVAFGTKPLGPDSNFILALSGSKLVEGTKILNNSNTAFCLQPICLKGDDVNEGDLVLAYDTDPLKAQYELTYRFQEATQSYIYAHEFFFNLDLGLLYTGAEVGMMKGSTKAIYYKTQTNEAKNSYGKDQLPTLIDAMGWTWKLGLRTEEYEIHYEMGSASGDTGLDENDRTFTGYSFNRAYNVGLIMFKYAKDYFSRQQEENMISQLNTLVSFGSMKQSDVALLMPSVEMTATDGAVGNAFYVNPIVMYKPLEDMKVYLGYLWSSANTARAIGLVDGKMLYGDSYGHEFDFGFKYNYTNNLLVGLELGYLLPGNYFSSIDFYTGEEIKANNVFTSLLKVTFLFGQEEEE